MNDQKIPVTELIFTALGEAAVSALTVAVYMIIGKYNYTVLCGVLLGSAVILLNFIFLCLAVNRAVDEVLSDRGSAAMDDEEAAKFAEDMKLKIAHWFTVDDLVYLKRGGRVSPTVAFVGNTLGIKPVLHVDDEGHLTSVTKARGRKKSIAALVDMYGEMVDGSENYPIYISHSDSYDDAKAIADGIEQKFGAKVELITDVGPVIGAHSGPGTLALFFVAKER